MLPDRIENLASDAVSTLLERFPALRTEEFCDDARDIIFSFIEAAVAEEKQAWINSQADKS